MFVCLFAFFTSFVYCFDVHIIIVLSLHLTLYISTSQHQAHVDDDIFVMIEKENHIIS